MLQTYIRGDYADRHAALLERHLELCESCRQCVEQLLENDPQVEAESSHMHAAGNGSATPSQQTPSTAESVAGSGGSVGTAGTAAVSVPSVVAELPVRYVPRRRIGHGGMGDVWEVHDTTVNRPVAIKFLSGDAPGIQETQRLLNEAIALGRLAHAGIVRVHELISDLSCPAIVMELVEGSSLKVFLRGQAVAEKDAAQLLCGLCEAVSHAHAHGVVHRDLKPSNVLLRLHHSRSDADGQQARLADYQPVVSDFGVARLAGTPTITQIGQVLGTPAYMAPEVASARPVQSGTAVDIYGLGAILYELLTGRAPHGGESPAATLVLAQRGEIAAPRLFRSRLSADLETICLKCLAFSPSDRYASAEMLKQDLQAWLENRPVTARSLGRIQRAIRWAKRNPLLATLLLLLLLTSTAVMAGGMRMIVVERRNRQRLDGQLDQAVALVEDILGNLRRDSPAWRMIPEDQQVSIFRRAVSIYGEYLEFHCPGDVIPERHMLRAIRHADLRQMLDPAADLSAELQRIERSLAALPEARVDDTDIRYMRDFFAQVNTHSAQKGKSTTAALELPAAADVSQVPVPPGLPQSTPAGDLPTAQIVDANLVRREAGRLMNVTAEYQDAGDFAAAARTATSGAAALESLISVLRDERDMLNYLVLADSAARNQAAAGDPQAATDLANAALNLFAKHPILDPGLQALAEPTLQSLRASAGTSERP